MEGYLYVGTSLLSLYEFNILGVKSALSSDALHLFCQCVMAIIPLTVGVQIQHLSVHPVPLPAGTAIGTCSWFFQWW